MSNNTRSHVGAHLVCFGGNSMKTVIEILSEISKMPEIISEIKSNYDISTKALIVMLEHINL